MPEALSQKVRYPRFLPRYAHNGPQQTGHLCARIVHEWRVRPLPYPNL